MKIIFVFFGVLISNNLESQIRFENTKIYWGIDAFPLDANLHACLSFNDKFSIGIEGELGVNYSNYIAVAGSHFGESKTLYKYQERDRADGEKYRSLFGFGIFTRILMEKKNPIDIGFKRESFIHWDDSYSDPGGGYFTGGYVKFFLPTRFKIKGQKQKRRFSIGTQISIGQLKEAENRKEFACLTSIWIRFYFNYHYKW
ncbi:MAG: hypothetical protein AB8H03_16160 [Saprospiraceae bacterium]